MDRKCYQEDDEQTLDLKTALLKNEKLSREKAAAVAELTDELTKSQKRHDDLMARIDQLTQEHAKSVEVLETANSKLNAKYESVKTVKRSIQVEFHQTAEECNKLKRTVDDFISKIQAMEERDEELTQALAIKTKDLLEKESELSQIRKTVETLQVRADRQHATNLKLKEAAEIFESEVRVMDNVVKTKAAEVENLLTLKNQQAAEIAVIKAENDRIRWDSQKVKVEKESLSKKVAELEENSRREKWDWTKTTEAKDQNITLLQKERNGLEKLAAELEMSLHHSQTSNNELSEKVEKFRLSYQDLQATSQERLSDLISTNGKNNVLTEKLERANTECEKLREEMAKLEEHVCKVEVDAAKRERELRINVRQLLDTNSKLMEQIEELKAKSKRSIADKIFGWDKDTKGRTPSKV